MVEYAEYSNMVLQNPFFAQCGRFRQNINDGNYGIIEELTIIIEEEIARIINAYYLV